MQLCLHHASCMHHVPITRAALRSAALTARRPYWMHHCLPGTYPAAGKALRLVCKQVKLPDGRFQCYVTQASASAQAAPAKCVYFAFWPGFTFH